jgi:tRNA threonylcarbamoyl adenosine modification protein YeaZ
MLILAVDTTSEMGGVAIFRDAECLAESPQWGSVNYSVSLFTGLEQLLIAAGGGLKQIDLFAVANGPGSFTGIRTGLAAALGWSKATGSPVRGVSILDALVEQGAPQSECAIPILDARRGEFYGALFRRTQRTPTQHPGEQPSVTPRSFSPVDQGFVLGPAALASIIRERMNGNGSLTCVVREHESAVIELRKRLLPEVGWTAVGGHLLAAIAHLARIAQLEGMPPSWQDLDACYIRRPDAEANLRD